MKTRLDDSLRLAAIPPGPELCAASAAKHDGLTGRTGLEVLEVVAAEARAVAYHQARLYAAAWEAGLRNPRDNDPLARMEYPDDAAVYEVGYQLGMGKAATGDMLSGGFELFVRVPAPGEALRNAEIDLERANVFAVGVRELSEEHARKVVAALLSMSQGLSIPGSRRASSATPWPSTPSTATGSAARRCAAPTCAPSSSTTVRPTSSCRTSRPTGRRHHRPP